MFCCFWFDLFGGTVAFAAAADAAEAAFGAAVTADAAATTTPPRALPMAQVVRPIEELL